jgi:hypothetical protein
MTQWGTDIGAAGWFGGGGAGWGGAQASGSSAADGQGNGVATSGGGGTSRNTTVNGEAGFDGIVALRYGGAGTQPEAGFPAFPVLIGAFASLLVCDEFTGVVQWPYIDMRTPGADKELLGFDLTIDGSCALSVGYNQRQLDYDPAGSWTAPFTVNGDTLPENMMPYSVSGPSFALRLEFNAGQPWEWFAANLFIKDLNP